MPRLSVTIIAQDEERDLPGCLESVRFADEIVVVDSGSSDRTLEIARAAGAKVFQNPWPGDAPQKAFAHERTTGDWVLNLDADERCSPALRRALPGLMAGEADGYRVHYQTVLFGRRVRFGGLGGERHLRLFRREKVRYEERKVHGGALLDGRVDDAEGPIVHDPYVSLDEYLDKLNRYTSHLARERHASGRRFSPLSALRLPWGFLRRYLFQLGFLDGYVGFLYASLSAFYDFLKAAKLQDAEREASAARLVEPPSGTGEAG